MMADDEPVPPFTLLLCLGPCYGEFYLPINGDVPQRCPNDSEHPVALYGLFAIERPDASE